MTITRCLRAAGLASLLLCSFLQAQQLNLIQKENRQPGTTDWQLTNPADNRQIEGYASLTSVAVGGDISLFVNTADATYSLQVFRMGWYGGKGGRKVGGPQVLNGVQQVTPTPDPTTGVLECKWTHPFTIHVPSSWLSGIYLVKLRGNTSGKESYIIFTVRDSRRAAIVFQQSVITYQAYNPWPGGPGNGWVGVSLYEFNTNLAFQGLPGYRRGKEGGIQAEQVSFSRPYRTDLIANTPVTIYSQTVSPYYGMGAGDFLHNIAPAGMDFNMVRWLEHEGYDVTYITDVDTHENVNQLLRAKGYISAGHDEYVTEQMKANIIQARDQGVSLGFFGANYIYWPVQLFPDLSGTPDRTISLAPTNRCVIPHPGDPDPDDPSAPFDINPAETYACSSNADCATGEACKYKESDYASHLDSNGVSETEQLVAGGMWDLNQAVIDSDDIVVPVDAPLSHWVFANTSLHIGDFIPGLIGTEYNETSSDPTITPPGLQTLLHTQAPNFGVSPPIYYPFDWSMTIYQSSSGAWVFNVATNQWSWGLDDYFTGLMTPDGADNGPAFRVQCGQASLHPGLVSCRNAAAEQVTRNVLNKFIAR
jgi:hypothetical protein